MKETSGQRQARFCRVYLRTMDPERAAAEARAWAESIGLIKGDTAGRKQYKSFCTREQLMTFLYRLVNKAEI